VKKNLAFEKQRKIKLQKISKLKSALSI